MSDNSLMYEVTQMLTDRTTVQKDMDDAAAIVQNMIQDRYVKKLNQIVQEHRIKTQKSPSREVGLLTAFKPFIEESRHGQMDKMIELISMKDTFQSIQEEFGESMPEVTSQSVSGRQEVKKNSIHNDGIYDIDDSCVPSKNPSAPNPFGLMMLMAMCAAHFPGNNKAR